MDRDRARVVLGVGAGADRRQIRAAYRAAMRATHPDVAGPAGSLRAAALNEAYAVLTGTGTGRGTEDSGGARGAGGPGTASPGPWTTGPGGHDPGTAPPPPPSDPPVPDEVLDGDTIHLDAPADEAFAWLLEACWELGEVTYVDRSCPIIETLVPVPGQGACSLVITLQGRADGTDAFCTLEAIERVAQPPVGPVTAALVAALRR